jgi:hypothetical protein
MIVRSPMSSDLQYYHHYESWTTANLPERSHRIGKSKLTVIPMVPPCLGVAIRRGSQLVSALLRGMCSGPSSNAKATVLHHDFISKCRVVSAFTDSGLGDPARESGLSIILTAIEALHPTYGRAGCARLSLGFIFCKGQILLSCLILALQSSSMETGQPSAT